MIPRRLVMGRKAGILEEAVHQEFGAQPVSCVVPRNEPDVVQALKNYRGIRLAAKVAKVVDAVRGYPIHVIVKKASLVYLRLKNRKSVSGGMEGFLVKFIPTCPGPRELVR